MKNCSKGEMCVSRTGYCFSRFRRGDWRRLYVQDMWGHSDKRAGAGRRLKRMILYYMGIALMTVGFLICFNAAFRAPGVGQTASPIHIEAGEAPYVTGSEFTILKGRGD